MKSKKLITALVELSMCMVMVTGCFPSVETDDITDSTAIDSTEQVQDETTEFPMHIEDDSIDKLKINADVILPVDFDSNQKTSLAFAEYRSWDRESILSKISNERQVIDENYGENTGPDDLIYSYTFDDNSDISFSKGRISYHTEMDIEFQYAYYFDYYKNYIYEDTLDDMFGEDDINGIEKNDALNSADEIISMLNINNILAEPKIYSMHADTINKLQTSTNKYGEKIEEWSNEQEAYLIVYPVVYDNIPSLKMMASAENKMISGSNVYFIYGRNGIVSFEISGIFDVKSFEQESGIYSPLNSIENVKNFFKDIIMDSELDISLVKLSYIIRSDFENINELEIEPVWFIYGKYENSSLSNSDKKDNYVNSEYITLISAVTGKTIPITSIGG